jgi:SAM-dependent methyltransferase
MNYQLSQAWSGVKQFQKRFDVFTGGGLRALAKRRLIFLSEKIGSLDKNHWRTSMRLMATKSIPGDVSLATAGNGAAGTKITEAPTGANLSHVREPRQGSEISRSISLDNQATRDQILLAPVSREAHIIEVGPSYNPIAPKAGGWNTKTLDHTTRENLIAHYRGQPGVDVNRIEEVDFVWTGGPLTDAVPAALHGTFDAFIASHVIEHTPDLIAFLNSAALLLKADGVVALAIPDKRYCFDYFQPLTTAGQLLAAHAEQRSRHTRRVAFDHVAYAVNNGGAVAWGQQPTQELRFFHTIEEARKLFDSIEKREGYVDFHAWRFTPASFELLLLELARLGETNWRVDRITPANGCEFFVWLRRGGAARAASFSDSDLAEQRLALLKRTLVETKDQIDWLLAVETGPEYLDHPNGPSFCVFARRPHPANA